VLRAARVRKVHKAFKGRKARQALPVHKVHKAFKGRKAVQARKVQLA